jgi:hypothetical protein
MDLKPRVRELLARSFTSVDSLEIVVLLQRSDAFWTPQAIAQQLGISAAAADEKLRALTSAHILARGAQTDAYRFAPAEQIAAEIDELLRLYAEHPTLVTDAMRNGTAQGRREHLSDERSGR